MGEVKGSLFFPLLYLVHPVRVEDPEAAALAPNALLGDVPEVAGSLEAGDTLAGGLTVDDTLVHRLLPATAAHADAVDDVALLGLVAHAAGLVRAGRLGAASDGGQLAVLPAAHAQEEAEHIALLLAPQLLDVLVGSHGV